LDAAKRELADVMQQKEVALFELADVCRRREQVLVALDEKELELKKKVQLREETEQEIDAGVVEKGLANRSVTEARQKMDVLLKKRVDAVWEVASANAEAD
jgi:hypothetical protein